MAPRWIYRLTIVLTVLAVFHLKFGLEIINPQNDFWLYGWGSDMLPDVTTWNYYRYSPLCDGYGLGVFTGYAYPQVTGVGNTNIIPWIAMPLHWINSWLPSTFQHFGAFLFLCFALQAYFADRLMSLFQIKNYFVKYGAVFCAITAAPLLDRYNHIALCAHWIILAGLCVYFSKKMDAKRTMLAFFALSAISALTHPYLILFPLALSLATAFKNSLLSLIQKVLLPIVSIVGVLLAFFFSGVFSLKGSGSAAEGFGVYSANINTFFNNLGKTNFAPLNLSTFYFQQYEGYAYLGLGVLCLYLAMLFFPRSILLAVKRNIHQHWGLLLVTLLMYFFALAFNGTFGDAALFSVHIPMESLLGKLAGTFRSSGRYIWLPFYLFLFFPFIFFGKDVRKLKPSLLATLSIMVLIVQAWDLYPAMKRSVFKSSYQPPAHWATLTAVASKATCVYTFPNFQRSVVSDDDMQYLAGFLGEKQIPITAGHLPRIEQPAQWQLNEQMEGLIQTGKWNLQDNGLIVTSVNQLYNFSQLQRNSEICIMGFGNYRILYKKSNQNVHDCALKIGLFPDSAFAVSIEEYLQNNMGKTILFLAVDEIANALPSSTRQVFNNFSAQLSNIGMNEPYAGIWQNGEMMLEKKGQVGEDVLLNAIIAQTQIHIVLHSTSGPGKNPYVQINNQKLDNLSRGLHLFVLDVTGIVQDHKLFDTYRTIWAAR